MPAYPWRGVPRNGENRQGRTAMEPSELTTFVEQRFGKGWRDLTVSLDDIQVGGICRQAVRPARRTWWADREGGVPPGRPVRTAAPVPADVSPACKTLHDGTVGTSNE